VYGRIQAFQNFHANRWFVLHSLFGLTYIATIIFILWQVAQHSLSPAVLILFVASYATVRGNVERLSENLKSVIEMNASVDTLREILPDDAVERSETAPAAWQRIELRGIRFTHPQSSATVSIPSLE